MPSIPTTHFKAGEALPPLSKNTWRVYSMRFCPFAHRTRLVIDHKNIPHELVNVNINQKPEWFTERNPLGKVPILEKDGNVVYESGVCNDYLEELFPNEKPLYPKDPYQKARLRIRMEFFGQVTSNFGALYAGYDEAKTKESVANIEKLLTNFEDALSGDFFGGSDLSMLDIHMWPFFERFGIFKLKGLGDVMKGYPKLQGWANRMREHPTIKKNLMTPEIHMQFIDNIRSSNPPYDAGL